MLSADEILAIPERRARDLFPGDAREVKSAFHALAGRWHPDVSGDPRATAVFQHLTLLWRAAARIADGGGRATKSVELVARDGRVFRMRYRSRRETDVGCVYSGDTSILVRFDEDAADIAEREVRAVTGMRFADDRMCAEMSRFLPKLRRVVHLNDGVAVVYEKTSDQFLLADLLRHAGGRIEPVHVAWMVSGLENIACYLSWAGLAHGAVDPTTVLVSPDSHTVALYGGWGFATAFGERPRALPRRTLAVAPKLAIAGVPVDEKLDLELLRLVGRECLGDAPGSRLMRDGSTPAAMALWLCMPPSDRATSDYASWDRTLTAAFGRRRFVSWTMDPAEIHAAEV